MVSLAFITRKFSLCSCILSNRNCIRLPPLLSTGNPIWWGWNTECNIAMPGEKIHSMSEHKIEPGFIGPNPKALLPMIGSLLPGNVLSTPYDRKSLTWQCTVYFRLFLRLLIHYEQFLIFFLRCGLCFIRCQFFLVRGTNFFPFRWFFLCRWRFTGRACRHSA